MTNLDTDAQAVDRRYRFYGRLWSCGESLDHLLPPAAGKPDCRYRLEEGPEPGEWNGRNLVYVSPIPDPRGDPRLRIWREGGRVRTFFSGVGAYHLREEEIVFHPLPEGDRARRDSLLLGAVSAFWMELRGLATLHASAVAVADQAVAFVSHSGGGKSSLASLLMTLGNPLLTDDVLPLEINDERALGWPGYPAMRLWPEEARRFAGDPRRFERVHPSTPKLWVPLPAGKFGTFHDRPLPLGRVYFPTWRPEGDDSEEIEIEPVHPAEGLIQLVRFSFAPLVARALGLEADRFRLLSQAARRLAMRRLVYPRGFEHLERVGLALERDVGFGAP